MALKESKTRYKQKKRNISYYQTTNLLRTWILLFVFKKREKKDRNEFVTKSVEIIATLIFM